MSEPARAPAVLAVIPARGGSKSLPRKNVRRLAGHPLLAYSVAAARAARTVSRVVVSTDDPEVAEAARAYGAEVPFRRPAELARDDTPDLPVFLHALGWLAREEGCRPDVVVQLRPTSPLRPPGCVDHGVALLLADRGADSVRAVTAPGQNPYKMWRPAEGGRFLARLLDDVPGEAYNLPRQALPVVYWQTGHLDVIRTATLLDRRSMTGRRVRPLWIAPRYAVDIDTAEQWAFAEWLIETGTLDVVPPSAVTAEAVTGPAY